MYMLMRIYKYKFVHMCLCMVYVLVQMWRSEANTGCLPHFLNLYTYIHTHMHIYKYIVLFL